MKSTIAGLFFLLMLSCGVNAQTTDKHAQKMKTELKLTDQQLADVTPLWEQQKQIRVQLAQISREDNSTLYDSLIAQYNELNAKVEAIFTDEQKKYIERESE